MCLAVPGEVLDIAADSAMENEYARSGRVRFGDLIKQVNLAFTPEVRVGDFVLVHAGFAITVLDADEAQRTLALLAEMDEENPS